MEDRGQIAIGTLRRHAANVLSGLRLLLTPAFLYCSWRATRAGGEGGLPAAVLYGLIAASDWADGRLARRLGVESAGGRMLDHAADIGFLLSALTLYQRLGVLPWWVPASVAASFAAYVVDSARPRPGSTPFELRASRLGHLGGMANYALVGVLTFDRALGLGVIPAVVMDGLFCLVPVYSGASAAQRLARRR